MLPTDADTAVNSLNALQNLWHTTKATTLILVLTSNVKVMQNNKSKTKALLKLYLCEYITKRLAKCSACTHTHIRKNTAFSQGLWKIMKFAMNFSDLKRVNAFRKHTHTYKHWGTHMCVERCQESVSRNYKSFNFWKRYSQLLAQSTTSLTNILCCCSSFSNIIVVVSW